MPKYIIEREIPGARSLTKGELVEKKKESCGVLVNMKDIQWLHSYVAGDKIYCIYLAANEDLIKEHASQGGFPANKITEISEIIEPHTAEA